jgi:hypothetical protein
VPTAEPDSRKVGQIVFKPDWTRHRKAAPFKRNDQMLETFPAGVIAFPGSGTARLSACLFSIFLAKFPTCDGSYRAPSRPPANAGSDQARRNG